MYNSVSIFCIIITDLSEAKKFEMEQINEVFFPEGFSNEIENYQSSQNGVYIVSICPLFSRLTSY